MKVTLPARLALPQLHNPAERSRILAVDFATNHQGREYDLPEVEYLVSLWIDAEMPIFCADKVMFMVQEQSPEVAEFHSVNGGTAKDLSAGVNQLLAALAVNYEFAATYYDNPRVNDLLKHADFPVTCTRLDDGQDRTFEAKFDLRSL